MTVTTSKTGFGCVTWWFDAFESTVACAVASADTVYTCGWPPPTKLFEFLSQMTNADAMTHLQ